MSFWSPNIQRNGRIARIITGLLMLAGAYFCYREDVAIVPWALGIGGVFVLYEGLRGWCVLRACKIRTPM